MLSFAKNERGIRMLSAALLFLPVVAVIWAHSRSAMLDAIVALFWAVFAASSLIAFLYEKAEEEDAEKESHWLDS